ncbi:ABC transporter ATP-binding protein [SAR202 cluster bacterium AD-804-J14_MRT_500m]|nr:ABC transporter ATP-binding protein [SAR202 cluster bacterium AD-804-J14_MRT_500m]
METSALQCTNLGKIYSGNIAVSGLNLDVRSGEVLALLGPSGCGKTTTLRLISGFELPDIGTIEIEGKTISGPGIFLPPERRHIGMVFQDFALFPHLTVKENVSFGLPRSDRRQARVKMILSLVGLSKLQGRMPHELSGGEQQRVALARALVPTPAILLLDEPFSNLDAKLRQQVREEVKEVLEVSEVTALFVTHDQEEALYMGDRVAIMNNGSLEQVDSPENVYQNPQSSFVARFVGLADFLSVFFKDGLPWTEAGPLPLNQIPTSQADLEVMVRPEDVRFHLSDMGKGRIISRVFKGPYTMYNIVLDSGESVRSLTSNRLHHTPGTRVDVSLQPQNKVSYFHKGLAVEW